VTNVLHKNQCAMPRVAAIFWALPYSMAKLKRFSADLNRDSHG